MLFLLDALNLFYFLVMPCSTQDLEFPDQGSDLRLLQRKLKVLTSRLPRKSLSVMV